MLIGVTNNTGSHEDTHTYTLYSLGTLIIVAIVFWVLISVYYGGVASGTTEMDAYLRCKELGETRHKINEIEIMGYEAGKSVSDSASLLKLPPGCGVKYASPCNSTDDCKQKIRDSLSRCWENIQTEPETTGTCLYSLDINGTIIGSGLSNTQVCAPTTIPANCGDTGVPRGNIEYDVVPQGNDTVSMEYGGSKIKVNCLGKCRV